MHGYLEMQVASSGYLEVQEASWGCRRKAVGIWRCRGQAVCVWRHRTAKKNLCDDPFQTVPGSIPGSCIPAFTGRGGGGGIVAS